MGIEVRPIRSDELEEMVTVDHRNFGVIVEPDKIPTITRHFDLDRFLVVVDDGRIIGAGGSFAFDLTLPGGAACPMAGVAWVSMAASHRRRGLLNRLMAELESGASDRGEPTLGLLASEGGIYERYGYGMASRTRVIEIDRRRAVIDGRWRPDPVELIDARDHVDTLLELWDRHRRTRPGELSRTPEQFRALVLDDTKPTFGALHRDGYALYTVEPAWDNGHARHVLQVIDLAAATPEAHLALWHLLLSVDLVGPVRSFRAVSIDDPLPHLLTDPRALRTAELNDGLWLNVIDPVRCFAARSYRTDDRLTIGLVESIDDVGDPDRAPDLTFAVGPDGAEATDDEPDLVACRAALGPLVLGTAATTLAAGRRLRSDTGTLARADALLGWSPTAHCSTGF